MKQRSTQSSRGAKGLNDPATRVRRDDDNNNNNNEDCTANTDVFRRADGDGKHSQSQAGFGHGHSSPASAAGTCTNFRTPKANSHPCLLPQFPQSQCCWAWKCDQADEGVLHS